ncbi:hypothetical protein LIER_28945 [Lithospermum erythrorhizon]|uniref:Hydroxyproline-rich glycoprotein family protein n=1 Tax=Lithospermum erythrorhizon TaxID=34254 RepID=A0AAV3RHH9_LITER
MMRGADNTFGTINAAASAIAASESHVAQAASQKTKWKRFWSSCWRFRPLKSIKRIKHAAIIPETITPRSDMVATENSIQTPYVSLPFVAPPSSPASFLPSEAPSSTQSPTGSLSLSSITAHMYSPSGPASMFAIGPYAHETQLVTPPTFSTYTTEPSTAPFTPPPESVQLTTPSSPEVPFARLVDPIQKRDARSQRFPISQYEFQSYLLHPGSPVSNLISPCSGISASGTSSPFPEHESGPGNPYFLEYRTGDHSKLLNLEKMSREWEFQQGSGTLTPDAVAPSSRDDLAYDYPHYDVDPHTNQCHGWRQGEVVVDHRVSFEINAEVVRCVGRASEAAKTFPASSEKMDQDDRERRTCLPNGHEFSAGKNFNDASGLAISDGENGMCHKNQWSITLSPTKEFNFGNVEGGNLDNSFSSSDWWANEKVHGNDAGTSSWSFFPATHPGVS